MKRQCSVLFALTVLSCGLVACNSTQMPATTPPKGGYLQHNLVADTPGTAVNTDPGLIGPRGISSAPGGPFLVANSLGLVKFYDASGQIQGPLAFGVAVPAGDNAPATPVGIVFSPVAGDFDTSQSPTQFLVATGDGTISGWGEDSRGDIPAFSAIAIDHSSAAANYTGLAIPAPACCREFLAAANFHSGEIETFTVLFDLLVPPGSFTDPNLPAGYAPFGIQVVGSNVFVTYALQDSAARNPVPGPGNGLVNIFDQEGNFVRRFTSNGPLNAPWAVVQASSAFGAFSNDILIGNFGDGTINAFDPSTGTFLGSLKDASGMTITNPGLWGLVFGNSGGGDPNTLYFTAGSSTHGLFGQISPN